MEKFISYEKSSKKRRRALDAEGRESWEQVKPFTRVFKDKKKYNRKPKYKSEVNE